MIELTDKVRKRFEIQLKKIYVGKSKLKKTRPTLNQIHYSEDGHVQMTNSHVGVRLSNVHDQPDSDEKFPNMNHLFELPDESTELTFNKETIKELESLSNVLFRHKLNVIKVKLSKDGILMTSKPINSMNFVECGLKMELDLKEDIELNLNPRYLHDALNMFRMLDVPYVNLHIVTSLRPIHLVYENLTYLITPIRSAR